MPRQWHAGIDVARYETWFSSVFHSCFPGSGLDARAEDATSRGRIDMSVVTEERVYLFEFKVLRSAPGGDAVRQLRERGYADKYRRFGKPIHLVGVEFDPETRNVATFETALA